MIGLAAIDFSKCEKAVINFQNITESITKIMEIRIRGFGKKHLQEDGIQYFDFGYNLEHCFHFTNKDLKYFTNIINGTNINIENNIEMMINAANIDFPIYLDPNGCEFISKFESIDALSIINKFLKVIDERVENI